MAQKWVNKKGQGLTWTIVRNVCFLKYQGKDIQKQLPNITLGKKLNKPIFKTKLEKFVTAVHVVVFLDSIELGSMNQKVPSSLTSYKSNSFQLIFC